MCSITESALDPALAVEKINLNSDNLKCKKCPNVEASVVLRGKDIYCKSCLLNNVQHKMRATLGKHKATRPGEKILIGVSGGENSVGLVHMLMVGKNDDHKKLLFTPELLWIDEGCVFDFDETRRRENISDVFKLLSTYGFNVNIALLEDVNSLESESIVVYSNPDLVKFNKPQSDQLSRTFKSLSDRSSRHEFLIQTRKKVLVGVAQKIGCGKIMTGETGTRLAVELMSSVACGVGAGLPHRVGFRDSRDDGVVILRPMREISSKEVSLYCVYNHLVTWHGQEVQGVGDTIRNVTQEFLLGLQENFPSTIPTVNRTGDKLTAFDDMTDDDNDEDTCLMCGSSLDTSTNTCHNALQATQYSSYISAGGDGVKVNDGNIEKCETKNDECCGEGDGSCKTNSGPKVSVSDVLNYLCYTCRRTFDQVTRVSDLPRFLVDKVKTQKIRGQMKSEIGGFLL